MSESVSVSVKEGLNRRSCLPETASLPTEVGWHKGTVKVHCADGEESSQIVSGTEKPNAAYATRPADHFTFRSTGCPFESGGCDILKFCSTLAMVRKTTSSAKNLPGQILKPSSRSQYAYIIVSRTEAYLLPKPQQTLAGSGFGFSPRKRSGLKFSGSGYTVSS